MVSNRILKKALKLIDDNKVRKENNNWYIVDSNEKHQVDLKRLTCDCTYFSLHQKPCSHILAVWLYDRLGAEFFQQYFLEKYQVEQFWDMLQDNEKEWQRGFNSCFEMLILKLVERFEEELEDRRRLL